jgi:hypothetical protein
LNTGHTGGLSEWNARFLAPVLVKKKKLSINCSGNIIFSVVDKILYFSYWKNGESIGSYVDLESQMMMAEGSLDMLLLGLNVTRYFSQGENSMNWHTRKQD